MTLRVDYVTLAHGSGGLRARLRGDGWLETGGDILPKERYVTHPARDGVTLLLQRQIEHFAIRYDLMHVLVARRAPLGTHVMSQSENGVHRAFWTMYALVGVDSQRGVHLQSDEDECEAGSAGLMAEDSHQARERAAEDEWVRGHN